MAHGFVHIIESPSATELLDGRAEGRVLGEALKLAGIQHRYNIATTRNALSAAVGIRLADAWREFRQPPILHLSMHGNKNGAALTNDDFVTWRQLRELLLPLLRVSKGGLLICMSCCQGGSGIQMAMYEDQEPPFWALVGNKRDCDLHDTAVAYITFYHLFFKGKSVIECVEAMKTASGDKNFAIFSGSYQRDSWLAFRRQHQADSIKEYLNSLGVIWSPSPAPSLPAG